MILILFVVLRTTIFIMAYSISENYKEEEKMMARFAKAMGHPARIAILQYLRTINGCCFGELHQELPISKSTVSQHLAELKKAGLITGTIDPPRVNYCIKKENWELAQKLFLLFFENCNTSTCLITNINNNNKQCTL